MVALPIQRLLGRGPPLPYPAAPLTPTAPILWSDWPARRRPARSVAAGIVLALTVGAVATYGAAWGLLAALVLLGSTGEALLPTRFALNEDGVRVDHPFRRARRPWTGYRTWRPAPGGFWLARNGPLRARGVLLRCPGREAEVEDALRSWLGDPEESA